MSWPAIAWALGQTAHSSSAKFLLVALADSASAGDWLAWPSVAYLSETTQQDRKTILANLQRLRDQKLIEPVGKAGRTGQIVMWRLPVVVPGKTAKSGTVSDEANSPKSGIDRLVEAAPLLPRSSTSSPDKKSQKRDTDPVRNPKGTREPADNSRGSRLPAEWSLPEDWRAWALNERPDLPIDAVAASFADHWRAQPGRDGLKADWCATWRNWVRRERKWPATPAMPADGAVDRSRNWLDEQEAHRLASQAPESKAAAEKARAVLHSLSSRMRASA